MMLGVGGVGVVQARPPRPHTHTHTCCLSGEPERRRRFLAGWWDLLRAAYLRPRCLCAASSRCRCFTVSCAGYAGIARNHRTRARARKRACTCRRSGGGAKDLAAASKQKLSRQCVHVMQEQPQSRISALCCCQVSSAGGQRQHQQEVCVCAHLVAAQISWNNCKIAAVPGE